MNGDRGYNRKVFETNDFFTSLNEPSLDDVVVKTGRSTGQTTGKVSGFGTFTVSRPNFSDQTIDGFTIVPITDPNEEIALAGDSGAVWYIEDSGEMLGLHTAQSSSPTICYASYATKIFEELDISLTKHSPSWNFGGGQTNFIDPGWLTQQESKEITISIVPKQA